MNIYYFTGTGNSIAICRELQKNFEDAKFTSIASFAGRTEIGDDSDVVGFVVPTYYMDIPEIVRDFVSRLRLRPDAYVFAVIHYGLAYGRAFHSLNGVLETGGCKLSLGWGIALPDNSIVFKTALAKQPAMHSEMTGTVSELAAAVSDRRSVPLPGRNSAIMGLNSRMGAFMFRKVIGVDRKRVTEVCTHCGLCSDVCPVNNVTVSEDNVVFGDNCAECFACIHWCPQRAVRFGLLKLTDKSKYTNPVVSAADVISQNEALSNIRGTP
ncbi:MAG: EFR1 family ferrodoxin [Candidatus Aegiribacteria sp.]|nr:EFR1 family ferrodoxin [Candidatus Aegiribacteria sp.]